MILRVNESNNFAVIGVAESAKMAAVRANKARDGHPHLRRFRHATFEVLGVVPVELHPSPELLGPAWALRFNVSSYARVKSRSPPH